MASSIQSSSMADLSSGSDLLLSAPVEPSLGGVTAVAAKVCVGCRCGWLCCECATCCMSCKFLRRYCICAYDFRRVPSACLFCQLMTGSCTCEHKYRCKWCHVSMLQCRRGGCLQLLPARDSIEAQPFVEIFNTEVIDVEEEDLVVDQEPKEEKEKQEGGGDSVSLRSFATDTGSERTTSITSSFMSLCSAQQEDWWRAQRNESDAESRDTESIATHSGYDSLSE